MINESQGETLDWKQIYMIPRVATIESYTRSFQYLIINNALFLNKKLFRAGLVESAACTFCEQYEESLIHFLCECHITKHLWKNLQRFLRPSLSLPELNLKNVLAFRISSIGQYPRKKTNCHTYQSYHFNFQKKFV